MDDLIAFVAARLDEARQRAGAMEHDRDWDDDYRSCLAARVGTLADKGYSEADCNCDLAGRRARALREVEAGRALVAEYRRALEKAPGNRPLLNVLVRLVRGRAAVWCDHPDYRPEWEP